MKCQSNQEIAGSPRNRFRASLVNAVAGGRALNGLGGVKLTEPNQTPNAGNVSTGVGQWRMTVIVERETTQTAS